MPARPLTEARRVIAYSAQRQKGKVVALVLWSDSSRSMLPGRVRMSDGRVRAYDLNCGVGDGRHLAHAILWHHLNADPGEKVAEDFAWEFVARPETEQDGLFLNVETIAAWLRVRCPHGVAS